MFQKYNWFVLRKTSFYCKNWRQKFFYCGQSYHRKSDAGQGMSVHQIIYSNLNCNNNDLDKILNNLSITSIVIF